MKHLRIDDFVQINERPFTKLPAWTDAEYFSMTPGMGVDWRFSRRDGQLIQGNWTDHVCKIGDHIIVLTDEEYQARVGDD